jgi:hypothetical protein
MTIVTHRWPLLLMLLAVAFLGITGWSVHRASSDFSGIDATYRPQQSSTSVVDPSPAVRH